MNLLKASEWPKRGHDVPRGLLERSWGLMEGSCEALGSISMAFGKCFGATLELGKRFRIDLMKYRKTINNIVMYCKNQGSTCQKLHKISFEGMLGPILMPSC